MSKRCVRRALAGFSLLLALGLPRSAVRMTFHPANAAALQAPLPATPLEIVSGPDHALWFTAYTGNSIGRIAPTGSVRMFAIPTPNSGPLGITVGPDGAIWFTEENADQIGRLDLATGKIQEYAIPSLDDDPDQIRRGPDGALWFTSAYHSIISRLQPTNGRILEHLVVVYANDITAGPDGALWFTVADDSTTQVARLATTGQITFHSMPGRPTGVPNRIVLGPDGALWFTLLGASQLGRLTTHGRFSTVELPISQANGLTVGPDGNLWFIGPANIGRLGPRGTIRVFDLDPDRDTPPADITAGPDGALWFTEPEADLIGRITVTGTITRFDLSPEPGQPPAVAAAQVAAGMH